MFRPAALTPLPLLLLLLLAAATRPAAADQSMLEYVPSDCPIAVLADFDQINADTALAGTLRIYWSQLELAGGPPLNTLTSLAAGIQLPATPGADPKVFVALKANAPIKGLDTWAASEGATLQTVDGRPMYIGEDKAWLPSNDKTLALLTQSPAQVARMLDPAKGNVTTLPGFTLRPDAAAKPFLYVFGGGFDEPTRKQMETGLAEFSRTTTAELTMQGLPGEIVNAASAVLRHLPLLARADAMEFALLMDANYMTVAFRVTTANPDHVTKLRPAFDGLAEFLRLSMAGTGLAMPAPQVVASGATIDFTLQLPKQLAMAQINMAIAAGQQRAMMASQQRAAAGQGGN